MDTVFYNARVYLERGRFAGAVLVEDGRVRAVGGSGELLRAAPTGAEKIDAGGALLLPGFNDAHLHLHDLGRCLHRIQAQGAASIDDLVERGRAFIDRFRPPPGAVITGAGWNEDLFTGEKRQPTRLDLDRISTEQAVIIDRACGHSVCCNTLALRMAGVDRHTPQVPRGVIERDEAGEPLGIFREMAIYRIKEIVPPGTKEERREELAYAMGQALSNGLTTAATWIPVGEDYEDTVDGFIRLLEGGTAGPRLVLQCTMEREETLDAFAGRGWVTGKELGHPFLRMGPVKLFADGSLGSRTAWLRQPYRDRPETRGLRVMDQAAMNDQVRRAAEGGFQVLIHCIGDGALDEVLNAFETVTAESRNPLRHGALHCQITDLPLLRRMARNDILAVVQPVFLTHDMYIVESRVGADLAATSYAWNTMEKLGIRTAYSTDCPVESLNPLACIDCAVNRRDLDSGYPEGGFYPEECVDVYTAVDNYTAGGAYAAFAENDTGRIRPGYRADLVLLDRDIFTIPKGEIKDARVLLTMVDGRTAYRREAGLQGL
jgi:predicted amidohydrolase YtcJ